MLMRKEWRLNPNVPRTGTLLARILAGRGLTDPQSQASFLKPDLSSLRDPFLLPDMEKACDLIIKALTGKQLIAIHGDYDVDGLTATALLARFFRRLGASCLTFIPDRLTEGYGLNAACAGKIREAGGSLLITADCGSASSEEVAQLSQSGISVIITDHHECPATLPEAAAIVNPKRADSRYPFRELAGVGVVFKLIQALCRILGRDDLWLADLELAALGTVADVVPLLDENRVITRAGLDHLTRPRHCGLAALLDAVGMTSKPVTAQTLGYVLAPRLNAAGRLGQATAALELLLTDDPGIAAQHARDLVELNRQRQELETAISSEAMQDIEKNFDFASRDLIIVAREGWHQGVIGIVASRLAEQYCRPVIVLTGDNGIYRGSCRSWGDFDILAAISSAGAWTSRFGGHRKAAGLTVLADRLDGFRQAANEYARQHLEPNRLNAILAADLETGPEDLTLANALALQQMAPFGEDNPQPTLICRHVKLDSIQLAGGGRHLKLQLAGPSGDRLDGIAFGLGEADDLFAAGDWIDVLFSLEINTWMGQEKVQMNIRDLAHCKTDNEFLDCPWIADDLFRKNTGLKLLMRQYGLPLQAFQPSREEYKTVYQFIRSRYAGKPVLLDLSVLTRQIARSYRTDLNPFRLIRILSVFQETSLISMQPIGADRIRLLLLPAAERVRLEDSPTYRRLQAEGGNL